MHVRDPKMRQAEILYILLEPAHDKKRGGHETMVDIVELAGEALQEPKCLHSTGRFLRLSPLSRERNGFYLVKVVLHREVKIT